MFDVSVPVAPRWPIASERSCDACTQAGGRITCSEGNRHQPGPLLTYVAVSVILSKKAPNHLVRYDVRMDGQRRAALAKHKGERQWTRPHYSSSFSWCCCSAAADSSTVAGFESDGRRTDTAPADLGGIGDRTRCESYDRAIVPRLVRWAHSCCHAKSRIV